ncbi:RNase H domain-containing protein [Abeliophyllum distichum]|uniref:RNase H domain-containing protein n=1 Tax=Abeliophyllum distichum TaxID=126358 RepID=A0ABD1QWC8_9LAMI
MRQGWIYEWRGCYQRSHWALYQGLLCWLRDIFILEAELRAILQDIELARWMGLVDLWIETDSTLAVHCISRGGGPWVIQSMLRHIRHLLSFDRDIVFHIFREGNQVADSLAFEGWDRQHYQEYGPSDLPRRSRELLQTDRFGRPSVKGL